MRKKQAIALLLASFAVVMIVGLPSNAADSVDMLTSLKENMTANQAWWTSLWELNYNSDTSLSGTPPLSDMVLAEITQWFFAGSLIIFIIKLFLRIAALVDRGPLEIFKQVYPFVLSAIIISGLMANNSHNLKGVIFDIRTTMNSWPALLLDAQITDTTARQALADSLVTDRAQLRIALHLQSCKPLAPTGTIALPNDVLDPSVAGPMTLAAQQAQAFRACMKSVQTMAAQEIEKAENDCGLFGGGPSGGEGCKILSRFRQKVTDSIQSVITTEEEKLKTGAPPSPSIDAGGISFLDFVAGMTANAANRPLLSGSQWLWISFLELAVFLTGIAALINTPVALIPGRSNIAIATLIAFLTLGLANVMYVVTIGVVALLMSNDQSMLFSDMRFPLALGLFAPIVSFAVIVSGGIAAANAFTGASFSAANVVFTMTNSIIGNAGAAMSRGAYSRR